MSVRIGVFDSGLGGLSVLHDALQMLPGASFIYYADQDHVPYGEKTDDELRGYVRGSLSFLIDAGVDAIVIACNTATTVATKEFRSTLPVPVVGMEPAVKLAIDSGMGAIGRILVAATPVTVAGDKLHVLLGHVDLAHEVDLVALPGLVRFAERGVFESPEVLGYLAGEFGALDLGAYSAIVLGCTHFDYFRVAIRSCFGEPPRFFNGNAGTIRQLVRKLRASGLSCGLEEGIGPLGLSDGVGFHERVTCYSSGRLLDGRQMALVSRCMEQLDRVGRLCRTEAVR
ncbi:MAG: glutamate racemase [Actinomycetota bacterium]|nr:glutamate racemase [Actinomycetota bacterium]